MKHFVGLLGIVLLLVTSCVSNPSTTVAPLTENESAAVEESSEASADSEKKSDGGPDGRIQICVPYFDRFGMQFEGISELENVFAAELICSVNDGIDLRAEVVEKQNANKVIGMLLEKEEENRWHLWALFPKTGEYVITLFGKEVNSSENTAYGMARLFVSAVVPTDKEYYFLTMADRNKAVIIENGKVGESSWYTFGGSSYTKYRTGKIAAPLDFTYRGAPVRLEKGTDVTFLSYRDNSFIGTLLFTSAKNIPMQFGENRLLFAKDSEVYMSSGLDFYGTLAESTTLHTDTVTATVTEGSVVYVDSGDLYQIDMKGSGTISLMGENYECTDTISLFPYKEIERTDFYIADKRELSIGSTSFTAPAGSYLSFQSGRLSYVIVPEEMIVEEDGKKTRVAADKLVRFREDGSIETISTAK